MPITTLGNGLNASNKLADGKLVLTAKETVTIERKPWGAGSIAGQGNKKKNSRRK